MTPSEEQPKDQSSDRCPICRAAKKVRRVAEHMFGKTAPVHDPAGMTENGRTLNKTLDKETKGNGNS